MGHTGTLDPMVTGVLPVFMRGATRFIELLPDSDKKYRAVVQLGVVTDTLDCTGTILQTREVSVGLTDLQAILPRFRGDLMQIPPMVSALKKDGVRLYDLARQGQIVDRPPRKITIHQLELLDFDAQNYCFTMDVHCSKGTYIRSLADDMGALLGCGAALKSLCRTYAAGFSLADCLTLETVSDAVARNRLQEIIIPLEKALASYPTVRVTAAQATRFRNGGPLDLDRLPTTPPGFLRVYAPDGVFLGMGQKNEATGQLDIQRLYHP